MNLKDYFSTRGKQASLSKNIGAHQPDVYSWKNGKKKVPVHFCVKIERATNGQVTRKDLRPDDWHLIWPELATTEEESS